MLVTLSKQILVFYCFLPWFLILPNFCISEKVKYITLERPVLEYYNKKYVPFLNVTARRYSRNDPNYYFNSYGITLLPIDNNVTASFYYYEYSNNAYKKTLLELHFKICDLLNKDKFIGAFFTTGSITKCPSPPGVYYVANSTLALEKVPRFITIQKGRVHGKTTYLCTGETIFSGYIDIDVKERFVKTKKGN